MSQGRASELGLQEHGVQRQRYRQREQQVLHQTLAQLNRRGEAVANAGYKPPPRPQTAPAFTDRQAYSKRIGLVPGATVHVPYRDLLETGQTFGHMSRAAVHRLREQDCQNASDEAAETPEPEVPSTERNIYSRQRPVIPGAAIHIPFQLEVVGKTFGATSTTAAAELRAAQHRRPATAPAGRPKQQRPKSAWIV